MSEDAFPWYDSLWLSAYVEAKAIILRECPHKLDEFEGAMNSLRAPHDFHVRELGKALDASTLAHVKKIIEDIRQEKLEKHELFSFGRLVVHDHPEFTKVQLLLTDTVSDLVGEAVQPSYNFLSLYNNLGVCKVHMDAPLAKWTLDICIEQSEPWPIHFSQRVSWPEHFEQAQDDWHSQIVDDPELNFQSYTLQENQAVVFCGSSQWHYRNRIARTSAENYCHLLFLHYVPVGSDALLAPGQWHKLFGIPELSLLTDARYVLNQKATT